MRGMSNRGVIAAAVGIGAGLLLAAAYFGAPYAGLHVSPTVVMIWVAIFVFGSTVALITQTALTKTADKSPKPWRRLSDLARGDYPHFPKSGLRLVLKPDTVIEEWGVVKHPDKYKDGDAFLTIKKATGKAIFNPVVISRLFGVMAGFGNFLHIILVNEHDEFIGYIPAPYARLRMTGPEAENRIRKYVVDVLDKPSERSIDLREIGGLSMNETIGDNELITEALRKLSEGLFRGFVVFRGRRNRKPLGVIWEDDLYRAAMKKD